MADRSLCSGCGEPILWAYTPNGKRMPLDPDPVPPALGTYVVSGESCRPSSPLTDPPDTRHYLNHWTSCPNREQFKRPKGRR